MRFNINAVDLGDFKKPPYRFGGEDSHNFDEDDLIETHCGGYGYIESKRTSLFCRKLTADWTAEEKTDDDFDRNHFTFTLRTQLPVTSQTNFLAALITMT